MVIIQKAVVGLSEAALARFVARARRALRLRGTVTVLLTSSRELQRLNQRFRGKNKPTDVLSFPAMPVLTQGFAGDVAISAEVAAQNARRFGHTVADEIKVLMLHGVLHLAGYDHEGDGGGMERKERQLRRSLGLPLGLIERGGSSTRSNGLNSKGKRKLGDSGRVRSLASSPVKSGSDRRSTRASR